MTDFRHLLKVCGLRVGYGRFSDMELLIKLDFCQVPEKNGKRRDEKRVLVCCNYPSCVRLDVLDREDTTESSR